MRGPATIAPASDEISYEPALLLTMERALDTAGIRACDQDLDQMPLPWDSGQGQTALWLEPGVVDMEASAIMAWAQFRSAKVYQFFYTADYVDHHKNEWDACHEERTLIAWAFLRSR